jgi:hypothetical protein
MVTTVVLLLAWNWSDGEGLLEEWVNDERRVSTR